MASTEFDSALMGADVIFIVGTGVSAALTSGAPTATWIGLVRSGADHAQSLNPALTQEWRDAVDNLIDVGISLSQSATIISAASMVANALKEVGEKAFSNWLRTDIGMLVPNNPAVAEALLSFPFPILTTNYDTLLEQVGSRSGCDWTAIRDFHKVITRQSDAIGHLHGVWDNPDSIIMSESDYQRILDNESTQALERAISSLKAIVYVGFGGGLEDPNFSSLLAWQARVLPNSGVTHFRLCREQELEQLRRLHANDNVVPISYGQSHGDLAPFLRSHAPDKAALTINDVGLARDLAQETRSELQASMTAASVLVESGAVDETQHSAIIDPIFLPMPHAQYVRERLKQKGRSELARVDAREEVSSHDLFVVVGDEDSGLTTAIKWLALRSAEELGSAVPLYVRFTDCRARRDPFKKAVDGAAMAAGIIEDRNQPLPPHVLAVDDLNPHRQQLSTLVLNQIIESEAIVKILGCRQGDEEEVAGRLIAKGLQPRVLFLGRMTRQDIAALAEILFPGQSEEISTEALQIMQSEGLQRTPYAASLVLYLLSKGVTAESRNLASIIEAYVSLLISFGDPHENSSSLTETDLHAILAVLAEQLIWDEKPSYTESGAIQAIADTLSKFAWSASPSDVLNFLVARNILARHDGKVEFARYSYLTLFAAKRALTDTDFRSLLLRDPFYYSPVVKKYAALVRADIDLLEALKQLLSEELDHTISPGSPYEPTPLVEISELPKEPVLEYPDLPPPPELSDDVEFPESNVALSFGLVKSEMSQTRRLQRSLSLVSTALRDLDQIEDLDLKSEILVSALELWGRYITALSLDPELARLRDYLTRAFEKTTDDDEEELIEYVMRSIPAGTTLSELGGWMTSPKLASLLTSAISAGRLKDSAEKRTATLLFLFAMRSPGWTTQAEALVADSDSPWVISTFFRTLCEQSYVRGDSPEDGLLSLCRRLYLNGRAFASAKVRVAHVESYAAALRLARTRRSG